MRAILFDMDGVLYNAETPIAGASEVLSWVRAQGIPHLFVTNTSSRSRAQLVEKLARFGISATEGEIFTPAVAAAAWLSEQADGPVALFTKPATWQEFHGLSILPDDAETGARYVVIGDLQDAWDFRTLNRAFRLLQSNRESILIALGMTRYWQAADGLRLDVAPFVAALEHASGRQPLVFGKPAAEFFHTAAAELGVVPADIVMVGDDIESDIAGAHSAGLWGALVQTGKFRAPDLQGKTVPDAVLSSIAALPAWWLQAK
jgi:HAD superfamily hydrolase (TIGR01458 family)